MKFCISFKNLLITAFVFILIAGCSQNDNPTSTIEQSKVIQSSQLNKSSLTDDLVAYYPFNGNANDESGTGNDAAVYGATLIEDRFGNSNSAYNFSGTDYIQAPDDPTLDGMEQLTLSVWVNADEVGNTFNYPTLKCIIGKGWSGAYDGYSYNLHCDHFFAGLHFNVNTEYGQKHPYKSGLVANGWRHMAATYDGSSMKIYIDAELYIEAAHSGTISESTSNFEIGRLSVNGSYFSGSIDDIRVYRRALTESEIADLYNEPIAVEIDIKPGSDRNSVNPKSKGVIPVAILTTDMFNAADVDPLSVEFGPNSAAETHKKAHFEDVDNDGDIDMVLHFRTQETGIDKGDTEACLTGMTYAGFEISGCDAIKTVGGKKK